MGGRSPWVVDRWTTPVDPVEMITMTTGAPAALWLDSSRVMATSAIYHTCNRDWGGYSGQVHNTKLMRGWACNFRNHCGSRGSSWLQRRHAMQAYVIAFDDYITRC